MENIETKVIRKVKRTDKKRLFFVNMFSKFGSAKAVNKKIVVFLLLAAQLLTTGYGNNQAYHENLLRLAQEEMDNQNYTKSMEYLIKVKVYAKENKLYEMQAHALNRMGFIYTEILSYDKAIECYMENYQIASKLLNSNHEISTLNNIGQLYSICGNVDKAKEYFEKAYQIAEETNSNSYLILYNLAAFSNNEENWEQTEKYINLAEEKRKQFPKDSYIIDIKCVRAEYFYLRQEYDLAEQLLLEILDEYTTLDPILKVDCFLLLSKIYNKKGKKPQAVSYAKKALQNSFFLPHTIKIYEHLSEIHRAKNSLSLALQYQDSAMKLKDSLQKSTNMSQILKGQVQFDLNNLEKKMVENKAKQKQERIIFILIFAFTAVFTVMFALMLRIRLTKNKQLKKIAELELKKEKLELEKEKNEKLLLEQQFKERETLALLERKTYENEIELKNRQLVSKTLSQLNKNELMEDIIYALSHISNQSEVPELQPIIQKLKSQIKETATWNSFFTYFEQTNPSFLAALKTKHPDLTVGDIRLASYIYLNLDTKEIAKLLQITPEYSQKKKQYLAQKLGMPTPKVSGYLARLV